MLGGKYSGSQGPLICPTDGEGGGEREKGLTALKRNNKQIWEQRGSKVGLDLKIVSRDLHQQMLASVSPPIICC